MPDEKRHLEWLYGQLTDWEKNGWLMTGGADAIRLCYGEAKATDYRRVTGILFAALAALLIGGGIILILAHNWDDLSRPLCAVIALLPLIATYALAVHALRRKQERAAWNDGTAVGNVCALASAIAIVAQTYNIHGELSTFLLTVCVLSLPVAYLL
jgi:uncharacterized membrane protein